MSDQRDPHQPPPPTDQEIAEQQRRVPDYGWGEPKQADVSELPPDVRAQIQQAVDAQPPLPAAHNTGTTTAGQQPPPIPPVPPTPQQIAEAPPAPPRTWADDMIDRMDEISRRAIAQTETATRMRFGVSVLLCAQETSMNLTVNVLRKLEREDLQSKLLDLAALDQMYQSAGAIIDRIRELHGMPPLELKSPLEAFTLVRTPNALLTDAPVAQP